MNPLLRWLRFNLVGAMGMVLQLATLAALNHLTPGHYLIASAAAVPSSSIEALAISRPVNSQTIV